MKRADTPQQKEQRKTDILTTAADLFQQQPNKLPTVGQIAKVTGITRGTIYIYFKTREDIFLTLIEDYFHLWKQNTEQSLEAQTEPIIEIVIDDLLKFLLQNSLFFRLSGYRYLIKSSNSELKLINYSKNVASYMQHSVKLLANHFSISEEHVTNWILDSFAFICIHSGFMEFIFPARGC